MVPWGSFWQGLLLLEALTSLLSLTASPQFELLTRRLHSLKGIPSDGSRSAGSKVFLRQVLIRRGCWPVVVPGPNVNLTHSSAQKVRWFYLSLFVGIDVSSSDFKVRILDERGNEPVKNCGLWMISLVVSKLPDISLKPALKRMRTGWLLV